MGRHCGLHSEWTCALCAMNAVGSHSAVKHFPTSSARFWKDCVLWMAVFVGFVFVLYIRISLLLKKHCFNYRNQGLYIFLPLSFSMFSMILLSIKPIIPLQWIVRVCGLGDWTWVITLGSMWLYPLKQAGVVLPSFFMWLLGIRTWVLTHAQQVLLLEEPSPQDSLGTFAMEWHCCYKPKGRDDWSHQITMLGQTWALARSYLLSVRGPLCLIFTSS